MKKSKAWAKEQLEYYIKAVGDPFNSRTQGMIDAYKNVEHIINQLDEPDERTQLEETYKDILERHIFYYNKAKYQVIKESIIPQFVAEWIENEDVDDFAAYEIFDFLKHEEYQDKIHKWVYDNDDETNREREITVLMALRYGYEVEKEKRYYIINKENNATLMTFELSDVVGEEIIEFVDAYSENETIHFDSKEKAELIAHFVGESLEVEEVTK